MPNLATIDHLAQNSKTRCKLATSFLAIYFGCRQGMFVFEGMGLAEKRRRGTGSPLYDYAVLPQRT